MKKVLLVLTNTRMSDKSIHTAITSVKKNNQKLIILFVIDEDKSGQSVINKLADEGWIGSKVSEELYKTIKHEYLFFGETKIKEIEQLAQKENIEFKTIIEEGNLVEKVFEVIEKEEVSLLITTRRKRSNLSRLIFGSAVADIKSSCQCKVEIIDE